MRYQDGRPQEITDVVISQQTDDVPYERVRNDLTGIAREVLEPTGLLGSDTAFDINPTGSFILGGPYADAGLTGRKIIVDTYGGVGSHGGGAFSGKDPSKVDRSAAYGHFGRACFPWEKTDKVEQLHQVSQARKAA